MRNPLSGFIIEIIGAFVCWAFGGFKGKLEEEMSGPYDTSGKSWRNLIVSVLTIVAMYFLFSI